MGRARRLLYLEVAFLLSSLNYDWRVTFFQKLYFRCLTLSLKRKKTKQKPASRQAVPRAFTLLRKEPGSGWVKFHLAT
jgi:hypothetical protein